MYASGDSLPTPWPESVIRFAVFSIFYLYFSHTWCSFPLPCCLFDRLYRVKHISQSPLSQTHNPLLLGPKIMWTRYTVFIKIDVKQCFIPARCQIISGKCWLEKLRFQRGVGAAWGGHSHCCCCWCCWDPRVGNLLITLMHLCSDIILKGVLLLLVSSWNLDLNNLLQHQVKLIEADDKYAIGDEIYPNVQATFKWAANNHSMIIINIIMKH